VVPELIEYNKRYFADLNVDFQCIDLVTEDLPKGDVGLVRQVLQHCSNTQILLFLKRAAQYRILIITEHIPAVPFAPNVDKPPGGGIRLHRQPPSGVVLSAAPFNLRCSHAEQLAAVKDGDDLLVTTAYFDPHVQ
jgi:hypothetical protein